MGKGKKGMPINVLSLTNAVAAVVPGTVCGVVNRTEPGWHTLTVAGQLVRIDYPPGTTAAQQAAGDAAALGFDATDLAEATRDLARVKAQAKDALVDATTALATAERCILRLVYAELVTKVEGFCNALRLRVQNTANPLPAALVLPTWPQVLAAVRNQIDGEVDPSA